MAHSRSLVSRIKGALAAGFAPKQLAYWTGVPQGTIEKWRSEDVRGDVEPDETVREDVRQALIGRFLGRDSAR